MGTLSSSIFKAGSIHSKGQAVAQWLRQCATSRKVAGSRADVLNELLQFT
jgi:hypothetical protein